MTGSTILDGINNPLRDQPSVMRSTIHDGINHPKLRDQSKLALAVAGSQMCHIINLATDEPDSGERGSGDEGKRTR